MLTTLYFYIIAILLWNVGFFPLKPLVNLSTRLGLGGKPFSCNVCMTFWIIILPCIFSLGTVLGTTVALFLAYQASNAQSLFNLVNDGIGWVLRALYEKIL